jgi:hypothetical protein
MAYYSPLQNEAQSQNSAAGICAVLSVLASGDTSWALQRTTQAASLFVDSCSSSFDDGSNLDDGCMIDASIVTGNMLHGMLPILLALAQVAADVVHLPADEHLSNCHESSSICSSASDLRRRLPSSKACARVLSLVVRLCHVCMQAAAPCPRRSLALFGVLLPARRSFKELGPAADVVSSRPVEGQDEDAVPPSLLQLACWSMAGVSERDPASRAVSELDAAATTLNHLARWLHLSDALDVQEVADLVMAGRRLLARLLRDLVQGSSTPRSSGCDGPVDPVSLSCTSRRSVAAPHALGMLSRLAAAAHNLSWAGQRRRGALQSALTGGQAEHICGDSGNGPLHGTAATIAPAASLPQAHWLPLITACVEAALSERVLHVSSVPPSCKGSDDGHGERSSNSCCAGCTTGAADLKGTLEAVRGLLQV